MGGAAAVLVLYPIFYLIQASLSVGDPQARPPEAYGLDNYAGLPRYAHIFWNTVLVAVIATVFAIVLGFAMGWTLSRANVPGREALEQMMALPYYVTPLMGALAWSLIGSPSGDFSIRSGAPSAAMAISSTSPLPTASPGSWPSSRDRWPSS